jgi:hypothetical protein
VRQVVFSYSDVSYNFVIALHEQLGIDIPETDYAKLSSVDDIVRYLASKLAARAERPAE